MTTILLQRARHQVGAAMGAAIVRRTTQAFDDLLSAFRHLDDHRKAGLTCATEEPGYPYKAWLRRWGDHWRAKANG